MSDVLIISAELHALRVTQDATASRDVVAPLYDFASLPNGHEYGTARTPFTASTLGDQAKTFAQRATLAPGVHLHWVMPSLLTHGIQNDKMPLRFPRLPNRWLLTRFATAESASAPTVLSRRWLIESDRLGPTPLLQTGGVPHPTVRYPIEGEDRLCYLGWRTELGGASTKAWSSSARLGTLAELTAIGYGAPSFLAIYPNCAMSFGAYDDLADVACVPETSLWQLAYQLSGWYEGEDRSTGQCIGQEDLIDAALAQSPVTVASPPRRLICTAAVHHMSWSNSRCDLVAAQPDALQERTVFSLGGTEEEALAAALAKRLGAPALENQLLRLQYGALTSTASPQARDRNVAERVHESGFTPREAGRMWTLKARSPSDLPAPSADAKLVPASAASLQEVAALSQHEEEANRLAWRLTAQKRQLFADWQHFQTVLYAPESVPAPLAQRVDDLRALIEQQMADLDATQRELAAAGRAIARAITTIKASLIARGDAKHYELTDIAAPRYWQPQTPVLMMLGEAATRTPVSLLDNGPLYRRPSDIATTLPSKDRTAPPLSALFPLGEIHAAVPDGLTSLLDALAREVALVSPGFQKYLAERTGLAQSTLEAAARTYFNASETVRTALTPEAPGYGDGRARAPHPLIDLDARPSRWRPVMMRYVLDVHAHTVDAVDVETSTVAAEVRFEWTDKQEVQRTANSRAGDTSERYDGATFLSAHGTVGLMQAIDDVIRMAGLSISETSAPSTNSSTNDSPTAPAPSAAALQTLRNALCGLPQLSQGLTGLHWAMLGFEQSLQLPVVDPYASVLRRAFVARVAAALGGDRWLAAAPARPYRPIEDGDLMLREVEVLDAFGQTQRFTNFADRLAVAQRMQATGAAHARLPARIVQPSRLNFRWQAPAVGAPHDHTSSTSPVLGWVLYQPLDDAVMFYTIEGEPIVSLSVNSHEQGLKDAMRTDFPRAAQALARHPEISRLLIALTQARGAEFNRFLAHLRAVFNRSPPQRVEQSGLSSLVGRPLALLRAALQLELAGGVILDQRYDAVMQRLDQRVPASVSMFLRNPFPVRFGNLDDPDDGLVGYWHNNDEGARFDRFYAPSHAPDALKLHGDADPVAADLTIRPGDAETVVTLLMDPFGEVNVRCGVLPVKAITLPAVYYAQILKRFQFVIHASPVLALGPREPHDRRWSVVRPKFGRSGWQWRVPVREGADALDDLPLCDASERQVDFEHDERHLLDGWLVLKPESDNPDEVR